MLLQLTLSNNNYTSLVLTISMFEEVLAVLAGVDPSEKPVLSSGDKTGQVRYLEMVGYD